MTELIKILCEDCEKEEKVPWFAIYMAFVELANGTQNMIEVINQRDPKQVSEYGGENIMTHHNTVAYPNGIRHSHFRVISLEDQNETAIGFLRTANSSQTFIIDRQ